MPHVPRQHNKAPSSGRAVHALNDAGHRDAVTQPPATPAVRPRDGRVSVSMTKLDPHAYDVSPDRVFKQLFGKEFTVDEHTGVCNLMVPARPGSRGPAGSS